MGPFRQASSRPRDVLHDALPRLYKFALALSANEELARALLRGTHRALSSRRGWRADDRDHLIEAFRRMYDLWTAKSAEDPYMQKKCPPEPRLFAGAAFKGTLAGNSHFARFVTSLSASQRAVLYLVYGEGASYDEAAEITGLNIQSFMKLLARGHLALSQWLDHRGLSENRAFADAAGFTGGIEAPPDWGQAA